jgi:hypothetical protein
VHEERSVCEERSVHEERSVYEERGVYERAQGGNGPTGPWLVTRLVTPTHAALRPRAAQSPYDGPYSSVPVRRSIFLSPRTTEHIPRAAQPPVRARTHVGP